METYFVVNLCVTLPSHIQLFVFFLCPGVASQRVLAKQYGALANCNDAVRILKVIVQCIAV